MTVHYLRNLYMPRQQVFLEYRKEGRKYVWIRLKSFKSSLQNSVLMRIHEYRSGKNIKFMFKRQKKKKKWWGPLLFNYILSRFENNDLHLEWESLSFSLSLSLSYIVDEQYINGDRIWYSVKDNGEDQISFLMKEKLNS